MSNTSRMVPLDALIREFDREELALKRLGDYQHAEWLRDVIKRIIRIANQGEPSIDPTGK